MKTVFFKSSLLIGLLILLNLAFSFVQAQSLKGKTWQSQDTSKTTCRPETIIFGDGTYTILEFFYSKTGILISTGHPQEGQFEESLGNLTFVKHINGRPTRAYQFKLVWINDTEFSLTAGIQKSTYALLGSPADHFSSSRIAPYLKTAISRNETIPSCFEFLASEVRNILNNEKLQEDVEVEETTEIISKSEKSSAKTFQNNTIGYSLNGKKWQCQTGSLSGDSELYYFLTETSIDITYPMFMPTSGKLFDIGSRAYERYSETDSTLSLTKKKVFSDKFVTDVFKIKWLNEEEFLLYKEGKILRFALFRSNKDIFTRYHPNLYRDY